MGKAIAYISIKHTANQILEPPAGRQACNTPQNGFILVDGLLSWGVQEGPENPVRIDIYAAEKMPLLLGYSTDSSIEIVSEKSRNPARVFLTREIYEGTLKIACMDCPARVFKFRVDPDAPQAFALVTD